MVITRSSFSIFQSYLVQDSHVKLHSSSVLNDIRLCTIGLVERRPCETS